MEDIITLRASFLIDHALTGLKIDFDRALSLLKNHNRFSTDRERQERDILVAAIDNLTDFAVAEESAMLAELQAMEKESLSTEGEQIFKRYNLTYAQQENMDVTYAARIAAWWLLLTENSLVTFMTQGDERVRPWHLSHEGVTYLKRDFPPELIPPLEWGCRCFLISDSMSAVRGVMDISKAVTSCNPIFRESLARCGRIFSDAHPYFEKDIPEKAKEIGNRIKKKFYLL